MNFLDLAKKRHSVRAYKQDAVEKEKVETILQAAWISPTAANKQPYHILVLQNPANLQKLSKGVKLYDAPLVFVVCGEKEKAWTRPFDNKHMAEIDATIVATHMMLMAEELGLASCWLTYFDPEIIKQELTVPAHYEVYHILPMGYSAEDAASIATIAQRHSTQRHPLTQKVSFEQFS